MNLTKTEIILKLIDREGGYVNHPSDRGGETNFGITEKTARRNGYTGTMQDLPRTIARDIYHNEYWVKIKGDALLSYSELLAVEIFDTAVLSSPVRAISFLQRSLNLLDNKQPVLTVDGLIGVKTINKLSTFLQYRKLQDGEGVLYKMLNGMQAYLYIRLAENNPTQKAFVFGWFRHRIGF